MFCVKIYFRFSANYTTKIAQKRTKRIALQAQKWQFRGNPIITIFTTDLNDKNCKNEQNSVIFRSQSP